MTRLLPNVTSASARSSGVHIFEPKYTAPITVVSADTWEDYALYLESIDSETDGTILSPELITSAGIPFAQLDATKNVIQARCEYASHVSREFPHATLLLGTAAWNASASITNSLKCFQNGQEVTERQYDKRLLTNPERSFFQPGNYHQMDLAEEPAICADVVKISVEGRPTLPGFPSARLPVERPLMRTLAVSACWAVPMQVKGLELYETRSYEDRFRESLAKAAVWLFQAYPNLHDVIVADRSIKETAIAPLNFHFQRASN